MAADSPRIAWLLNLDADRELQDPERYRFTPLARLPHDWSARITDLLAPDDVLLDDARSSPESLATDLVVQCFCPTPSALARVQALSLAPPDSPSFEVLRRVNGRAFCAELGHGLPDSDFVFDMPALERHLERASPSGRWVIKRAFSFAGREQRRIEGCALDESTRGFCRRSFARGEGVQVEPWVERLADVSLHGHLSRAGRLTSGSAREQHCDPYGRFVAVSTQQAFLTDAESAVLSAELERTAAALTAAGYFGPFGIDGFRYRLPDGPIAFNPRCEINARFTMGYPRAVLAKALGRP